MGISDIELRTIAEAYPAEFQWRVFADIRRQVFQVNLLADLIPGGTVADIGGGMSAFAPAAAEAGLTAIVVDDFADPIIGDFQEAEAFRPHRDRGVELHNRDVLKDGLGLVAGSLDAAICIDTLEHFHNSPKAFLNELLVAIRPGGWLLLGVPNCVHLRRRLTVPLGSGKWSAMADWYEKPTFRGHVREADVDDLRYIARDLTLQDVQILGRNWLGYRSARPWVRRVTPIMDRFLQRRPSLCSDLYLLGRKHLASTSAEH